MSPDKWSKRYDDLSLARIHKKKKREINETIEKHKRKLNKVKEIQGYGICEKCGKRDVSIENELINISSRKCTSSVPNHIWYCSMCNDIYYGIVD